MLDMILRHTSRLAGMPFRWSHTVDDYYPVDPKPRWRRGTEPYISLQRLLAAHRADYERLIDYMAQNVALLRGVSDEPDRDNPGAPYWNNSWFTSLDAAMLITLIASFRPRQYIEIGSGHSTRFAKYTMRVCKSDTRLTSIDPEPRQEIDQLCDEVIRTPLETCNLRIFDSLQSGDILFFDGSHRVFTNSDVVVFFFEVLPRLKPGVIVHVHDIFIPNEYPNNWNRRLYNEQYIVAAMLMYGSGPFEVLVSNAFIYQDQVLHRRVSNIFGPMKDVFEGNPTGAASLWFKVNGAAL